MPNPAQTSSPGERHLDSFTQQHTACNTAFKVTESTREQFIDRFKNEGDGWDEAKLKQVYQAAYQRQQQSLLAWANAKDAVASPYYRGVLFNNIPPSFVAHQQNLPAYDRLFGSLDYEDSEPCRSIFGPAAYFVDLMRFVERHIKGTGETLQSRRPDLFQLRLDCENTNQLMPYIDLVIEVLEGTLRGSDADLDLYATLAARVYPQCLPFHLYLERTRAYLTQLQTSLVQVYETFAVESVHVAREILALSPLEAEHVGTPQILRNELTALAEHFGYTPAESQAASFDLVGALAEVAVFLERTGLSRPQLDELLYQDLSEAERNAGLDRLFFYNHAGDGLGPLRARDTSDGERLENLSIVKLDRIHRFLRLARKLDWSFANLDQALRSLGERSAIEESLSFNGAHHYVHCTTVKQINEQAGQKTQVPLVLDSFTLEAWLYLEQRATSPLFYRAKGSDVTQLVPELGCGIDAQGLLYFSYGAQTHRSVHAVEINAFTHVAITVALENGQQRVSFYLDGRSESDSFSTERMTPSVGSWLYIGRDFEEVGAYFNGVIKDLRLWQEVRTAEHIAAYRYRRLTGAERGLAGYWPFTRKRTDELDDLTPNGNHGLAGGNLVLARPQWRGIGLVLDALPERVPQRAFQLNGGDQQLSTAPFSGAVAFTIEAWIEPRRRGSYTILYKGGPNDNQGDYRLGLDAAGKLVFEHRYLPSSYTSASAVPQEQPSHVCAVLDEGTAGAVTVTLYINGELSYQNKNVVLVSPQPAAHGTELRLGADPKGRHFDGFLCEVRLWDRPRDPEQLRWSIHRSVSPNEVGLIGYWPLRQVMPEQGETIDRSPYERNLKLSDLAMEYMPPPVSSNLYTQMLPFNSLAWLPIDSGANAGNLAFYLRERAVGTQRIGATPEQQDFYADHDPVTLHYGDAAGLSEDAYETLEIEFWFYALNGHTWAASDPNTPIPKRVILTQGNVDDGLVVYLHLGRLYVCLWYQDEIKRLIQQTSSMPLTTPNTQNQAPPEPGGWHFFRLVHDNRRAINEVKATLDGILLDVGEYFSFSKRSSFHLGGIPTGTETRFHDGLWHATGQRQVNLHGSIASALFWKTVAGDPQKHLLLSYPTVPVGGSGVSVLTCSGEPALQIREPEGTGQQKSCLELSFSPREVLAAPAGDGPFFTPTDQLLFTRKDTSGDQTVGLCGWLRKGELWLTLSLHQGDIDRLAFWRGPLLEPVPGSPMPAPRKWHHLAVNLRYDVALGRQSLVGYLNGAPLTYYDPSTEYPNLAVLASATQNWSRGLVQLELGGSEAALPCTPELGIAREVAGFQGEMAEVRLWSRTREREEVVNCARITLDGAAVAPAVLLTLRQPGELAAGMVAAGYRIEAQSAVWQETLSYPLRIERPIAARGFRFGGNKQYLYAAELEDMDPTDYAAAQGSQTPAFTVEAWVQTEGAPQRHPLVTKGNAEAGLTDFAFFIDASGHPALAHIQLNSKNETVSHEVRASGTVSPKLFTHVAVTVKGSEIHFFINGEADPSGSQSLTGMKTDGFDLLLGTDFDHDHFFKGVMAEVQIWHRALSAADLFNQLFLRPVEAVGLAARWPLADTGSDSALDMGPGKNKLLLGGSTQSLGLGGRYSHVLDFWDPARRAAVFSGDSASPLRADEVEFPPVSDRTLELWVKIENPWSRNEKQLLAFLPGMDDLLIYLHDGSLFFGVVSEGVGSWLCHSKVEAARWTHVGLAWQVEDRFLRAFVDGHLLGGLKLGSESVVYNPVNDDALFSDVPASGPAEPAMAPAPTALSVGGLAAAGSVHFHDGASSGQHLFQGQVLEVRLWLRSLAQQELRDNRYREIDDLASRNSLVLWWDMSRSDDGFVLDMSGNTGPDLALSRLVPLGQEPVPQQPIANLDVKVLGELAAIKRLSEDQRRKIDELSVLWHEPRHAGRALGPPLFDRVWNSTGRVADRWDFHRVRPLIWDLDGKRSPRSDRETQNRLTGALRLSRRELRALVAHLSGSETVVQLDTDYLIRLQRLASLASLLRLEVEELLILLTIAGQAVATLTPTAVRALVELRGWTREANLSVARLNYLLNGVASRKAGPGFTVKKVQALASELAKQPKAVTEAEAKAVAETRGEALNGALASLVGATPEWLLAVAVALALPEPEVFYRWAELASDEAAFKALSRECERIARAWMIHDHFEFDEATTVALLDGTCSIQLADLWDLKLSDLSELAALRRLRASIDDPEGKLISLLRRDQVMAIEQLGVLAGWDATETRTQAKQLGLASPLRPSEIDRLKRRFDLADQLRVDTVFLNELTDTTKLDVPYYRRQSEALFATLRARYTDKQWQSVGRAIHDSLTVPQRDALSTYVMYHQVPKSYGRKNNPDLLTEWLLLDVQMGSETDTSRIKQAILGVQYYIERCLMNLERGVVPEQIPEEHWFWMKNYRVWEANRKVFLYPENYIEPELRDTKSPLFEGLEEELLQQELNLERAATEYKKYLDRFIEVANLKIVGSYVHEDEGGKKTLYLVGRSAVEPYVFHYRQWDQVAWTAWRKIETPINSDFVSPVFAFGRLYLFWVETPEREQSRDRHAKPGESLTNHEKLEPHTNIVYDSRYDLPQQENYKVYTPEIKYTHLNFNGDWIQPQTYKRLAEISDAQHQEQRWRRVYTQHAFAFGKGESPDNTELKEAVKVWQLQRVGATFNTRRIPLSGYQTDKRTLSFWFKAANPGAKPTAAEWSIDLCSWEAVFRLRLTIEAGEETDTYKTAKLAVGAAKKAMDTALTIQKEKVGMAYDALVNTTLLITQLAQTPGAGEIQLELGIAHRYLDKDALSLLNKEEFTPVKEVLPKAMTQITNAAGKLDATQDKTTLQSLTEIEKKCGEAATAIQAVIDNAYPSKQTTWQNLDKKLKELEPTRYAPGGLSLLVSLGATHKTITLPFGWHHLSLTIRGTGGTFRLSSPEIFESLSTNVHLPAGGELVLGLPTNTSAEPGFTLQLAELRFWDELRTFSAIKADRQKRLRGNEPNLRLHQPLEEVDSDLELLLPRAQIVYEVQDIERVLLFYGDSIHAMVNTGDDHSINLHFEKPSTAAKIYDLDLYGGKLYMPQKSRTEMSIFDFAAPRYTAEQQAKLQQLVPVISLFVSSPFHVDFHATLETYLNQHFSIVSAADRALIEGFVRQSFPEYFKTLNSRPTALPNVVLEKLRKQQGTLSDVNNQPGWYLFNSGDEQYLLARMDPAQNERAQEIKTVDKRLTFTYLYPEGDNDAQPININVNFNDDTLEKKPAGIIFHRLNTSAVHELSLRLYKGGLKSLLSLKAQKTEEYNFNAHVPDSDAITLVKPPSLGAGEQEIFPIDFDGAYGLYYWEIFFHIPFLIANQLNGNQRFDEAQEWYHHIFNPTAREEANPKNPADRYWQFLPFRELTPQRISKMLANEAALQRYQNDPFDPHAIAALRIAAYQKAVVMKYIDNLLDWGDQAFTRDTRESISDATQRYLLAYTLLGPRPQPRRRKQPPVAGSFSNIHAELERDSAVPFFPIGEGSAAYNVAGTDYTSPVYNPNIHMIFSFCVPENEKFVAYWDRVEDRLYKIRHSLDIQGVFRKLALYEPPIDPMALVRAAAGGGLSGAVTSAGKFKVPHYRFDIVLEKARNMISQAIGLGGTLLSVLEKRDGEALELLRNTHEKQILDMMVASKQDELEQAKINVATRQVSLESAQHREEHYADLIDVGLSGMEEAQIGLLITAKILQLVAGGFKLVGGVAALFPNITTGANGFGGSPIVAVEGGGDKFSKVLELVGSGVELAGSAVAGAGEIVGMYAGYERRAQDWKLQRKMAEYDVRQIEQEIVAAEVAVRMAEREIRIHEQSRSHNAEIAAFHQRKFTSKALYNWMINRVSGLYFHAYKMAFDLAKSAEAAFNFELATDYTFIHHGHWDSLRKGLLAGESLMLELNRMEKSALEVNSRLLEIQRTFSLLAIGPEALWDLKHKGECEFDLSERLFDQDYPGHYSRQVKSISVSVPAVVGPYQGIKATLTQLDNKLLLVPDTNGVDYLLGTNSSSPDTSVLRNDMRARQQVALSRGVDDSGMFQLNFADERYLPFEGTGAVSKWKLEMPKGANRFDFDSITDVLIHLNYTTKSDAGSFRDHVRTEVEEFTGYRVSALAQEQPAAWHSFKNKSSAELRFTPGNVFPAGVSRPSIVSVTALVEAEGQSSFDLDLNDGEVSFDDLLPGQPKGKAAGLDPHQEWTLKLTKGDAAKLDNVLLLLAYQGTLAW